MIMLYDHPCVGEGFSRLLTHYLGDHDHVHQYVPLEIALLVITLIEQTADCSEWFPHGRWGALNFLRDRAKEEVRRIVDQATPSGNEVKK